MSTPAERRAVGRELARSYLPGFASQENRELDETVRKLEVQLQTTDVEIKENDRRVSSMADHLQDVQSELKYMHQRYDGKKKELDTEDHLQKISNRERVGPSDLSMCMASGIAS